MKLALLLFGISKHVNRHWSGQEFIVDYENSYENYKKYIFNFFENKGYKIDVYFTSNILNDDDKKKICEKYKPVKCMFIENNKNNHLSRNNKLNSVIDLCLESNINYDLVLITRFDLIFKKKFEESNIKFDKFNLVSILEKDNLICDNFYLFPYKYLKDFSNICKNNMHVSHHRIKNNIESIDNIPNPNKCKTAGCNYQIHSSKAITIDHCCRRCKLGLKHGPHCERIVINDFINYILNEHCDVASLNFYKILRTLK